MSVADATHQDSFEKPGCDAAIECSGGAHVIKDYLASIRSQDTVVLDGLSKTKVEIDPSDPVIRDIHPQGSLCSPTTLWPRVYSMITGGKLQVDKLVDAVTPLERLSKMASSPCLTPTARC